MKKIIGIMISALVLIAALCGCSIDSYDFSGKISGTVHLPDGYSGDDVNITLVANNTTESDDDERFFELANFTLAAGEPGESFTFSAEDIPFDEYTLSYRINSNNSEFLQIGYIDDEGSTVAALCTARIFGEGITDIDVCPLPLTRCIGEISLPEGVAEAQVTIYALVGGTDVARCHVSISQDQPALYEMYLPLDAAEAYELSYVLESESAIMPYAALAESVRPQVSDGTAVMPSVCLPGMYTAKTKVCIDESFFGNNEYLIVELTVLYGDTAMYTTASAVTPESTEWDAKLCLPTEYSCTMSISVSAPAEDEDTILLKTLYVTASGTGDNADDALNVSEKSEVPKTITVIN